MLRAGRQFGARVPNATPNVSAYVRLFGLV